MKKWSRKDVVQQLDRIVSRFDCTRVSAQTHELVERVSDCSFIHTIHTIKIAHAFPARKRSSSESIRSHASRALVEMICTQVLLTYTVCTGNMAHSLTTHIPTYEIKTEQTTPYPHRNPIFVNSFWQLGYPDLACALIRNSSRHPPLMKFELAMRCHRFEDAYQVKKHKYNMII